MSYKYVWPASALTREDMASLHYARTIRKQAINKLIAQAVRQCFNPENNKQEKEIKQHE